jgi:RimJ/RimL family protein N-acetyltransferase
MEQQVVEEGNWFYSVFLRPEEEQEQGLGLGEHIGSISLRHPPTGPELPPPSTFADAPEIGAGTPLSTSELHAREGIWITKNLNLRTLGYALFPPFWGKGYATEAGRGLLDAYAAAIDEWRRASKDEDEDKGEEKGEGKGKEEVFYVEAGVDVENPGSQVVLRKLGFKSVGVRVEKEKAWLNGAWRGPEWWICGQFL